MEDAKPAVAVGAGSDAGSGSAAGSAAGSAVAVGPGDAQVRVEWRDVPVIARASPGRTPCNTPRAAAVAPTPTWGIPAAIVIVEGARMPAAGEARVVLADCALAPRVAVGATLIVESAAPQPETVVVGKRGELPALALTPGTPRTLRLPIAGHAVAVALDAGGIYELATPAGEAAWLVAPPASAAVAVTDASGQVPLRALTSGAHAVTAWLPPRAGQPARIARGTVTVVAGGLAELTLTVVAAAAPAP